MADSYVQVAPDSSGKKVQTYENTVGSETVEAQAVVLVDSTGAPITLPTVASTSNLLAGDGAGNAVASDMFKFAADTYRLYGNPNGPVNFQIDNSNDGSLAASVLELQNSTNSSIIYHTGHGYTPSGLWGPDLMILLPYAELLIACNGGMTFSRDQGGTATVKMDNGLMVGTTTDPGDGIVNVATGFRIGNAAAAGKILKGNGTNFIASTETYAAPGTSGNVMKSDGTNWTSGRVTYANIDAGVTGGTLTLAENTSIALDPAGSADGKYSGITVTGTGGATIAFGDLVTLDKDDSRWELVDISVAAAATGDARGILGMAVTSSSDGAALTILLHGIIRADANFPALTIGAPVYASTTGDVVVAQPTTTDYVIRIIGYGLTADEMYFNPDCAWITHT